MKMLNEGEMTLKEELSIIQKSLVAPKGQYNSHGRYNYRSCEDIVNAVKKELPDGYILLLSDEVVMVGDRFYIKATVSISSIEESIQAFGYARETLNRKGMDESQITGAASSYARKYALNGLFAIDDTKDEDTNENKVEREAAQKKADEEYKKHKLDREHALHDKLIGMIGTIKVIGKVTDFNNNQKVKDLRDKLFLSNPELSGKIDVALENKANRLLEDGLKVDAVPSPSELQ